MSPVIYLSAANGGRNARKELFKVTYDIEISISFAFSVLCINQEGGDTRKKMPKN